ncbi:MAG: Ig-like domain-containing protein [candidate division KSB1 bacterium]|nr:Ig-like domain-containing protein [candidate division KSB1 bacterium]MDZ7276250.1 Ig-like domain-containing protein [candidate division KSB1 bacterium]MDZ7287944.1 Ig-like domain-containing protein [candidate division KSB1 bacterium]MDZ7300043.1 Ig-like domain-containing protein [candidate division KSB1 bacterium]MDZ7351045.1 Ig-like domain-containing protein [candidate division KSB1 bacterium]
MKAKIILPLQIGAVAWFALGILGGCKELGELIDSNQAPVIDRLVALREALAPADTTTIKVEAHDPEGGTLAISWNAAAGMLSSTTGSSVRWTAPAAAGAYRITVKVRDDKEAEAEGAVTVTVVAVERPLVKIVRPLSEAFLPGLGTVVIEALASHPNGIERVEFRVGSTLLGVDNSPPYQQPWRVEGLSGPARLFASAFRALTPGEPGVDSVQVSIEGATRL